MVLFKKAIDLHNYLVSRRNNGERIGFVPTMGALHSGHISLIKNCVRQNPATICSIFVNPTQFNDPKDYAKYPLTVEKDIAMLKASGCPALFLPSVEEVYPEGFSVRPYYDLGRLETVMEGKFRPGHFQGVCMVMEKLLKIVQPNRLFLGQKDLQQCMIISRLVELMGEKDAIEVVIIPTVRETDGLAMSSRNMRLNPDQRIKAPAIFEALRLLQREIVHRKFPALKKKAAELLQSKGLKPDYVEIARVADLEPIEHWDGQEKIAGLVAAWVDDVRLIDNLYLN